MINVFKENKELKKENTRLKMKISDDDYYHKTFLKENSITSIKLMIYKKK